MDKRLEFTFDNKSKTFKQIGPLEVLKYVLFENENNHPRE